MKVFRKDPPPNMGKKLRFDSRRNWKIATIGKLIQLIDFLTKENVNILGIQETRRTADIEPIHIPNYEVYESKSEKVVMF